MLNKKMISILSILICSLLVFGIQIYRNEKIKERDELSYEKLEAANIQEDPLKYINEDYSVDDGFSTNLPLVILDMNGNEPPVSTIYDIEEGRHVAIDGVEPYVEGTIKVIYGNDENTIEGALDIESQMLIKRRGNSSMNYDKAQYLVKFVTVSGEENEKSVLGMGADDEWILNGSRIDKSMIRNYMAFRISSQIFQFTPDNQYCEVLIKNGDVYYYQGLFLLGENIKQGKTRIDIPEYKSTEKYTSYIVKRDRLNDEGIMLSTYGTENGLTKGYLELVYPNKYKATESVIKYVEEDISTVEKILYSDKSSEFSVYPRYINTDSFVDYFIINEFFGNYDAGINSTYLYKDIKGKISIGPVWDFDGAMDNYKPVMMSYNDLAFYEAPWFDKLSNDKAFMRNVRKRYKELRKNILSDENISAVMDEIYAHIDPAGEREWYRWKYDELNEAYDLLSVTDKDGEELYRTAYTLDQEKYKIRTLLRKHGNVISTELKKIEDAAEFNSDYRQNSLFFLVLSSLLFILPIIYVAKNMK